MYGGSTHVESNHSIPVASSILRAGADSGQRHGHDSLSKRNWGTWLTPGGVGWGEEVGRGVYPR